MVIYRANGITVEWAHAGVFITTSYRGTSTTVVLDPFDVRDLVQALALVDVPGLQGPTEHH